MPNKSNQWNALDIVNSDNWSESQWLSFFQERLWLMEWKRAFFDWISNWRWKSDWIWTSADNQVNAVSFYDNDGSLQVNIPLEKSLKEIYMWRSDWKATFDIVPDGQANVDELQPSKYALNFFLDWNGKSNFWKENSVFRDMKAHYGSGIFSSDLKKIIDFDYVLKEDADIEGNENILEESNFNKVENVSWEFFPHNVHVRDFYPDDWGYGCPDVQKLEDCIFKENLTATELEIRYWKKKWFNIKGINYSTDPEPKNNNDSASTLRTIVIYHYFHRITRKYIIVSNRDHIIYNGRNLYNDWKLPFVNVQHYSNQNRFWGEGIPERVAYLKAYKSEIFQDILAGAEMASWINLLTWNDDQIGQDWTVWGRGLNLWRATGWADKVQPINTNINLGFFTAILDLLEKQITIDSWINPLEQFDPISDKVGIVEIMEANKAIRNKSVDENYNIGLDSVLTMTLDRIKQFAPSLLATAIMSKDGKKVIKTEYFEIRIDDHKVEKKRNWHQTFTENIWKFGYFELKPAKRDKKWKLLSPATIQWLWVKIITASTNSMLPLLERQKVNEYIDNRVKLANMAVLDPSGAMMKKLVEQTDIWEIIQWMWDAYGYDVNGLKANTEKDNITQENLKMIEDLQEVLTINRPEDEVPWQVPWLPTGWQAPAPTGWEQIPEGWTELLQTAV